jgi:hypothetical protein
VLDPDADRADLERERAEVVDEQRRRLEAAARRVAAEEDPLELTPLERATVMKSMGGMEDGDTMLGPGSEINLESHVYWWHDKYRPRKPKYFNRVHTGYEWNKHNQTHYDHDRIRPRRLCRGTSSTFSIPIWWIRPRHQTISLKRRGNMPYSLSCWPAI